MAGEPILIVDDTPVNLKLTRILLVNEGYTVLTAGSAEEALDLLRDHHPHLVLADIQLPGMDGLEFTRRVKKDESTRDILVVALTAFAMKGDEQKAIDAGCDGYITKPIDTRSLGERIRGYLSRRTETRPAAVAEEAPRGVPESVGATEMDSIRTRFLLEGQAKSRQLLVELEGPFSADSAAKTVHQWVGTGGLLGYSAISRLSREAEIALHERPLDNSQLRESLTNLMTACSSPREAYGKPVPESLAQRLAGKRIALVGIADAEKERLSVALERVPAKILLLDGNGSPDSPESLECDLAVVQIEPGMESSPWLDPHSPAVLRRPYLFVGSREALLALPKTVQSMARDFLMDAWLPDEALVRCSLAVSQRSTSVAVAAGPVPATGAQIVIASRDSGLAAQVSSTLQNFGMQCRTAADGSSASQAMSGGNPQAAVLDVSLPGIDAMLSSMRSSHPAVRILLLAAGSQENEVLRGFTLGAGDFVVTPFNPLELLARLSRLLEK
jgi:two-component system, cell cycle response regulator DivK